MERDDKEFIDSIQHGLVAIRLVDKDTVNVVHFVGFVNKPTPAEIEEISNELNNDPRFDMTFGQIGKTLALVEASPEILEYYKTNKPEKKV
mgnify:CR=1 FL=1